MKIFSWGKNEGDIGEGAVSETDSIGYIDNIRVADKGQGTGTKILRDLEAQLTANGVTEIQGIIGQYDDTDPDALRRFYERNGYQIVDMDGVPTISKKVK